MADGARRVIELWFQINKRDLLRHRSARSGQPIHYHAWTLVLRHTYS